MHVLYVHPNFPAQFGHIAQRLIERHNWTVTFAATTPGPNTTGIQRVVYKQEGGATDRNHFCARTFENTIWNCDGVYNALKARPDIKPDLIVGHSGFGSTLFLRELYGDTPIINFFEFYYHVAGPDTDMGFRKDLGWTVPDAHLHRARCRNAMILLDLQHCDAGYVPTEFQFSRFPAEYSPKLRVIFDGIDRTVYHGHDEQLRPPPSLRQTRTFAAATISPATRVVTYVSRGFESMRGFDIFMRSAQRMADQYPDVLFIVVGSDRICYGGDDNHMNGAKSFKQWTLSRYKIDLAKFVFTGPLPPAQLARLLAATDLHVYLSAPFVLSWSLMDALSCGAVVLGSATSPVKEMIVDGENGLLADFFDVEDFARKGVEVLRDPASFRPLGRAAEKMIDERYGLDVVLPKMVDLYTEVCGKAPRRD
ncbi:MAG TPA: glycosyltransferase [Tepidisphaeraceae bacterium]|jgi:glycosyltransferase involved in cell wall biosynthesis|nr:glycosyltransferase [Tepidisphaeraceae bacterium]